MPLVPCNCQSGRRHILGGSNAFQSKNDQARHPEVRAGHRIGGNPGSVDPYRCGGGNRQFRRYRRRRSGRRLVTLHPIERLWRQSRLDRQCALCDFERPSCRRRHWHLRHHQHRWRHAEAARRQQPDRGARYLETPELGQGQEHQRVPGFRHTRFPVHRLRGQDLRLPHGAAR